MQKKREEEKGYEENMGLQMGKTIGDVCDVVEVALVEVVVVVQLLRVTCNCWNVY